MSLLSHGGRGLRRGVVAAVVAAAALLAVPGSGYAAEGRAAGARQASAWSWVTAGIGGAFGQVLRLVGWGPGQSVECRPDTDPNGCPTLPAPNVGRGPRQSVECRLGIDPDGCPGLPAPIAGASSSRTGGRHGRAGGPNR
jgi:hypothetical protein